MLSTVIQLELFFVVTAVALWLDQLYHGAIALMATQSNLYQVFLTIVIIVCYHLFTQSQLIQPIVVTDSLAFNGTFFHVYFR
jgi:hypothetical protein